MPMNRYEIRDEYSLADPELYRAADKDDPEALLEGVAMAGLVGVLRQLGDLSEFAAEIFHDLHEEVMVTAARGNSLMIRVQQLESDVHSVEKAFLSQTDHSKFFYNAGVEWKANQQVDQNLIAQGNLPRFVMDSYEECRGPPRLFLLDKFDIAGAGACLKRYTDPSFFKVEASATANADFPREKKIKKAKKKGPRVRYGERPEFLQLSSHTKLHQLLLEEPVENGVSKPAYRAKLKRRQNRFPFDSVSGTSYMDQLLKSPSPEHKMLDEITVYSTLQNSVDDHDESAFELRSVSPVRETEGGKSNPPYADKEDTMLNPSMNQSIDALSDIRTYGVPDVISSISDEETGGKGIAIEERSLIGYLSDDIASEIDNYVDAPSTMLPEMDSDSELRVKSDFTLYTESQPLVSVKSQEHCHTLSLDSLSTGEFSLSDEGNNSYKKEMSSFLSSDSPRTSAENPQSEKLSADRFPCTDNASSLERAPEHFHVDEVSESVIYNYSFPGKDSSPNNRHNIVQPTSSLCRTNSVPTSPHYDVRAVARGGGIRGGNSDETISNSDDEDQKRELVLDSPCSSSVSHSKSLGDNSQRSTSGGHLMDGEIPWVSRSADNISHSSDRAAAISPFRHEDDYDQKDLNHFENRIGTEEIVSEENPTLRKLENKVAKLDDNFAIDYYDIARLGENVASDVSEGDNQYNLCTEYPNIVSEPVNSETHCSSSCNMNQINAETLILSGIEHSVLLEDLDTHDTGVTPEESELGNRNISEVGTDDVAPNDLVPPESSFYVTGNIGDYAEISYAVENDGVNPDGGIGAQPLTEISSPLSLKSPSQVHVSLHEFDPVTDQSETSKIACFVPAVSDDTNRENGSSPVVLGKLVEEHVPCFQDLGMGVLENGTTSLATTTLAGVLRESEVVEEEKSDLSGSHLVSSLVEEVKERETAILDFDAVFRTEHFYHPKPQVSPTDFSSYLDSEVKHKADLVSAATLQLPLEQSGLDTEEESFQQSSVENQVSAVDSLHVGCVAKESLLPESSELPPASIDDELLKSSEILSSEMSSILPTNQLQQLDHYCNKEFENLASSFPHVNHPSSVPVFPDGRGYGADASAYPKDSLGFIFPPGDLFLATNQISLDQLQPLPPLPPLQWRKGKLQHASSSPELDKIEIKELLPQETFPRTTSIEDVSSLVEQMKQSPIQSPQITFKEENLECGSSSKANSLDEAIDLPQKVENEHPHIFTPMESEVPSPAEVVGVAEGNQTVKLPFQIVPHSTLKEDTAEHTLPSLEVDPMNRAADPPPKVKVSEVPSPAEEVGVAEGSQRVKLPVQIVPHSTLKEDTAKHTLPSLEVDPMNKAADSPPKMKASEVPSSAEEVGVAEGSQTVKLPVQIVPHFTLKEENAQHCSPTLEADPMNQAGDPPLKVEKEQLQLHLASQESEVPSPAVEDEVSNESRKKILPRTCNPVIGSVAALDKSRLRKVTERVAPQVEKQDERDALLDQIRAKSFNLKPTAISRPSIQAPNTNLRVAAILEKANAIRQAFAGSDEDDEDNWSDS